MKLHRFCCALSPELFGALSHAPNTKNLHPTQKQQSPTPSGASLSRYTRWSVPEVTTWFRVVYLVSCILPSAGYGSPSPNIAAAPSPLLRLHLGVLPTSVATALSLLLYWFDYTGCSSHKQIYSALHRSVSFSHQLLIYYQFHLYSHYFDLCPAR